ncbi:unnamed protein product [Prorocentrum cordatum]|uniref:Uncharacterized protein n=1 Tax=Prorocentrum cordatum TaxID=2364126 RepID=A0ABN9VLX2_9DINO|nr:unnamed protein product [Polarella glacialis]
MREESEGIRSEEEKEDWTCGCSRGAPPPVGSRVGPRGPAGGGGQRRTGRARPAHAEGGRAKARHGRRLFLPPCAPTLHARGGPGEGAAPRCAAVGSRGGASEPSAQGPVLGEGEAGEEERGGGGGGRGQCWGVGGALASPHRRSPRRMATLTCSRFFDYTQKKVALGKSDKSAPLRRSRSWRPATPRGPAGACARARAGGGLSSGARRQRAAEELAGRPSLRRGAGKSRKRVGHAGEHDANPRRSIDGKAASSRRGHRWPALGETGRRKTASHPGAEAGLGGLKKKLHELANRVGSGTGSGHVQPEPPGTLPRCARAGQMRGGRGWERGDERWVGAGRLGPRPGSAPGPAAGRAAAVPDSPAASGRKSPDEFLSNSWLCESRKRAARMERRVQSHPSEALVQLQNCTGIGRKEEERGRREQERGRGWRQQHATSAPVAIRGRSKHML